MEINLMVCKYEKHDIKERTLFRYEYIIIDINIKYKYIIHV